MEGIHKGLRGAFITVEGIEGTGKSTSIEGIKEYLLSLGHDVRVTREPGGTDLGERIRDWILHGEHGKLSAEVEALLMFAARGYHLQHVIVPALERGQWVVCDRFTDATYAYQGGGRGLSREVLDCLSEIVQRGLQPDLTLLLDAPPEVTRERIRERTLDHFERERTEFFDRVRAAYLARAAAESQRIRLIDAAQPQAKVRIDISEQLQQFASRYGHGR